MRSPLKWLGSKYRIIDAINKFLPKGKRLVELFVGSVSVFLNTNYQSDLLNDSNRDLINLYIKLNTNKQECIEYYKHYFSGKFNNKDQ